MDMTNPSGDGLGLTLPKILDGARCEALQQALSAAKSRGVTLGIDASRVQRVSTLALQVFAAAGRDGKDGAAMPFRMTGASPAFAEAVRTLALSDVIDIEGEAA